MRKKAWTIIWLLLGLLVITGETFAYGAEKQRKTVPTDARMQRLHAMMPMFSIAAAELESALEKGDANAVWTQANKILAAVPDLRKSKPHKNVKQWKRFVGLATNLDSAVKLTADLAQHGDFIGAKTAFKKVEETCVACHALFRD